MFAHGFNITSRPLCRTGIDVGCRPSAGHRVREVFMEGGGVPG